ncbi:hypothetical protein E3P99_00192 [Wallemia hederae]|uniref:Uncharacterized protein n=1 Tax=Wallemia hederae TaxID=1540922 RepID=A0A4T0FWN8_9BASI|nr:hypothetical protein E3P99_00192 [Wallemia hederae]
MLQSARYALRARGGRVRWYSGDGPSREAVDVYKAHWPRDLVQYTRSAYDNASEALKFHNDLVQKWGELPHHTRISTGLQNVRYISYNDINREGVWMQAVELLLSQPNMTIKEYQKLIRFLHKASNLDDGVRQTLLLKIIDRMIQEKVQFTPSIVAVIWSKKMHWRDTSFTLRLWQRMYDAGIAPGFDMLYHALKVAAKRGNVVEAQVYLEHIGRLPGVSRYEWRCAQSTFVSALEGDILAAEVYYNSLDSYSQSGKARLSILSILAKSPHLPPSRLVDMVDSLPQESNKCIAYISVMRGLAIRKLYHDVISVYGLLLSRTDDTSRSKQVNGILKPVIASYAQLGLYDEAIQLLDEHSGRFGIGVVHPLLNSLAFRRERYGVWWVWNALVNSRWKVLPNSATLEITLKASFNQYTTFRQRGGIHPSQHFTVEAYHINSFRYHVKELSRGFRAELRDMTLGSSRHGDLEHSEMFWRRIEGVFRGILLGQHEHLHSIEAPVSLSYTTGNWDNLLTKTAPQLSMPSVSITKEHFDAYIKMLFERRSSGGSYENTNLILQAMAWMRELQMQPSRTTLLRSIIALNESISPMFMPDMKRLIASAASASRKQSTDQHTQLFALDSFNKSHHVEAYYKWVNQWLEMPHEMDIFIFWIAEMKRIMLQ